MLRARARECARVRTLRAHLGQVPVWDMNMPKRQVFNGFAWLLPSKVVVTKQNKMSPFATISPRHEGVGESDNEHLCGALDPVTDQNVNRGDVRSKKHDCHNAPLFRGGYHHQND